MQYPGDPQLGLQNGKFNDQLIDPNNPPSIIPAAWANALTDELITLAVAGGQVPDEANLTQIRDGVLSLLRDQPISTGAAAAYTLALPAYADAVGRMISFLPHVDNAQDATLDIDGQGAHDIYYLQQSDGALVKVSPGVMRSGRPAQVVFINGDYILNNPFETTAAVDGALNTHAGVVATTAQLGHVLMSNSLNSVSGQAYAPNLLSIYRVARSNWATRVVPFVEANGPTVTLPNDVIIGNANTRAWMICGYGRTQTGTNGNARYLGARLLNSGGGVIKDHPSTENRNWVDGSAPVFETMLITAAQVPANGIVTMHIETRSCAHVYAYPLNTQFV